jgi:phosphonate metabolism protein PhnN/1,5-bisphosphokinase (PRPP-forming)
MPSGTLFLVVGPSGAGKDTLLDAARVACPDVHFPKREITRPAGSTGEDHVPITETDFSARQTAGAYALSWRAHELGYGVPVGILDDLAGGRSVVVNVSRGVLDTARARAPRVRVVSIRVPSNVLTDRLRRRGRETEDQIAARVARADSFHVSGADVIEIVNDGSIETAIQQLTDIILSESSNH